MTGEASLVQVDEAAAGRLVALELDSAPFPVRRIFVVTSDRAPVDRGGHEAGCRQLAILVTGRCRMELANDAVVRVHDLRTPGESLEIAPTDFVAYRLLDPGSTILVLADQPYQVRPTPDISKEGPCQTPPS